MKRIERAAPSSGYRTSSFWRFYDRLAHRLDYARGWYRLPRPLGLLVLIGVRNILRQRNLYDTDHLPSVDVPPVGPWKPEYRTQRTADGTYNDLQHPEVGRAGSRFGRNIPLDKVGRQPVADLLDPTHRVAALPDPNPPVVSRELLTREVFRPATTLNALAAAWLQFMIKDWFNHGPGDAANAWRIPLAEGDPFPDNPMIIRRTPADPTRPAGDDGIPTFINHETPWWDGSQL